VTAYYHSPVLPWSVSEEEEERFRRILRRALLAILILSLIMAFLPVPQIDRSRVAEVPERLAKLMLERPVPPPPPPVEVKKEVEVAKQEPVKKPEPTPKPKPDKVVEEKKRVEAARAKAERSGLLAFKDDLADLRDTAVPSKLNKDLKPGAGLGTASGPGVGTTATGVAMGAGARSIVTSNVAAGSGGIAISKTSVGTGGGGLAGRSTTQVASPVGGGAGGGGGGGSGGGGKAGGRSIEEIKLVFDKNKGAIYALYNRALRSDPTLQGKVVLKLTIAPSGAVSDVQIVSTDLKNPELERKLLARIKQFDFGAKDVAVMVVTYPIDFLPS
jgi:TonB family protein